MSGWFDDDEDGGEEQVARADPRAAQSGWDVATDWVTDKATEFAYNAETQLADDPLEFVARATGAPSIKTDTDAGDGTLGLHVQSVYGTIDADWQDGQGSKVHSQLGMDWGAAPYVAADLTTDNNGEITKASGTAKLTVPLEVADVKAEATGGYEKTADGYKASFSESGGVSIDGVELMVGLHGAVQDNGEHGATVTAGPHGSVGMGKGSVAPGFDIAEGALKGSTDFTYGEQDGQTTIGVSQTTGAEVKVFGQTVAQAQNTVGVEHTDGPQGERTSVSDTVSGTVGNQKFGGTESGSEQVKYSYGTDASGNEISLVTTTTQVTETNSAGQQSQLVNDTTAYDVEPPDDIQSFDIQPVDDVQTLDDVQLFDDTQPLDDVQLFDDIDAMPPLVPEPVDLPVVAALEPIAAFEPIDVGTVGVGLVPDEPSFTEFGGLYPDESAVPETSSGDEVTFDVFE